MTRMSKMRAYAVLCAMLAVAGAARLSAAYDAAALTQDEVDRIRDAQDPSNRIIVYLEIAGERLERFNAIRLAPADSSELSARGATLDQIISQYIAIDDELKRWIEDQYDTGHDMRKGLRALIESAPKQLALLNQAEQTPDRYAATYQQSLHDAITDLNDTINGATQGLAYQDKQFAAAERQEKTEVKDAKLAAKEEKKREKQERKLRKKQDQRGVPEDEDQQN